MSKRIKSMNGFFGQILHFKDGIRVGESWPGLFNEFLNHYDTGCRDIGYSDRGMITDLVHHNEHGGYAGATYTGLLGEKKHYSSDGVYIGETWEGLVGKTTALSDNLDSPDTDNFFSGDDW